MSPQGARTANFDICANNFYFLLFDIQRDATPIEASSSIARDMKAPDVGFRIQLADR